MSQAYKVAFVSKQNVLTKMNNAVKDGGEKLQGFAKVSGMSGQEFAETWKKDPYAAVQAFEKGLANQNKEGQNVKAMLKELGITELRETDTVLRLANGNKQLQTARENANKGYKEGNALSQEAETKYKTLGNQMKIFMNHVRDLGIEIGSALSPILIGMMKVLTPMIDALAKAPAPIKLMVVALGLIPIVAVPVLASLAGITGAMGLMGQAMNTATYAAGRNSKALRIYAVSMGLLTSPIATSRKALGLFSWSLKDVGTKSGKTTKVLSGMPGVFRSTGNSTKGTTTIFQRLGKVMGAVLIPFKLLLSPLRLLKGLMPLLGAGVRTLGLAFRILTGPIGIAVTILITLYKTIKYAYNNVEWFRKGVDGLIYTFKVFGGGIIGTVTNNLNKLGNGFSKAGEWIKSKFTKNVQDSYKALDDDDLLKKGVEGFKGVMKTMGTATDKATDSVKVLGKGVSKETKGALGSYIKYSNNSNKILEQVKLNHGDISKKKATELLSIEEKLTNDIVAKLEKRKQDELKNAQEVFENSKALSQKEKDAIIAGIEDRNDKAINKEKELSAEIKRVKEAAMADGNISEKEMAQIEKLENQRRELTVKNLTKTEKEQGKILSRMKNNREALSISEASSAIKSAEKAKKSRIKEINDEYDDKVYAIEQMVGLSKAQKKKLLDEAEDEKTEQIKKAKDKKQEVVDVVKEQNKDIDNEMDLSNGKVYSKAEQWWNNFSDGFTKEMSKAWANMSKNASNFGKLFVDGMMDIGAWIMNVKAKADSFWNQFGTALAQGASNVVGTVGGGFSSLGTTIVNGIMNIGSWIMQVRAKANSFWNSFGTTLVNAAVNIGQAFMGIGAKIWNGIKQGWNIIINSNPAALWTSLTSALGTAWAATKQWFITKGQQMGSALSQGWAAMKGFVVNTFGSIWTFVKSIWQGIWSTISYWSGAIWNRVKSVWSWIKNNTTLVFTSVWNFIKWIWTSIKNTVVYWTGAIWNRVKAVWTWIKNNTVNAFTGVWNTVKRIWAGIKGTIVYWTTLIWNRIKSVWSWIKSNTLGAFTYVWNTIKRIWSGIKNTVVYWTQAVWNRIKAVWAWIKSNTLNAFNYVWNTIKRIWKGIKGTIVYWTTAIWNRVKSVWNWIKSNTASAFTWVWNKIKSIWKGIKGTITYWTGAIWNRVKGVWNWIKSNTASAFTWVWNKIKSIWKGIKGTITYWTNAIWNKVKSIWNTIKNHTYNIFNAIWNKLKSIWNSIFGTIKYWMNEIWTKVKNGWNSIKKHTVDMVTKAKDAVVDKFTGMYDGAKKWIDKIGSYIDDAKKWMKDKAVSLGKSVANGAISGLNKMIGGINKISKAITSKKLMDEIPELSTGTSKGKPKSNSKGQLKQPTTAVVNDKGRGNGRGPNGHQEIIQKSNGQMFAPRGKNVVVGLEKGDIVHSGQDTQAMKSQGIIPQFSSGTPKKKKNGFLESLGNASKGVSNKISDGYHSGKQATKDAADAVKEGGAKVLEKGKDAAGWLGDKIGDVWDYVKDPGKLVKKMMDGISFGKENKTMEMAGLAFNKLKKSLVEKVKSWFEEAEGGDGDAAWLLKHKILQTFGHYTGGLMFNGGRHYGIDFGMPTGTKIRALTSGKITQSGAVSGGGGNQITLKEPGGKWYQWYMHMSKLIAKKGQTVNAGDVIGLSGNTGNSTTPHLHIQRMKGYPSNETAVNPMKWLKSLNGGKNKKASAWSGDIKRAASRMGVTLKGNDLKNIISLINAESGGNAGAVQSKSLLDINTLMGNPAQGLLQYIPQTFKKYAVKGHTNIKSGYDQLLAFFNNRFWRSQFNPNGGWSPSGPRRFAHGGMIKKHGLYEAGEGNRPEMVLPLTNKVRAMQLIDQAKSFMGVDDSGDISTTSNDNNGSMDVIAQLMEQNNRLLEALINTVDNKELTVDKNAIVDIANTGMARKYKDRSYIRGGR